MGPLLSSASSNSYTTCCNEQNVKRHLKCRSIVSHHVALGPDFPEGTMSLRIITTLRSRYVTWWYRMVHGWLGRQSFAAVYGKEDAIDKGSVV